jgi:hypothetical protein
MVWTNVLSQGCQKYGNEIGGEHETLLLDELRRSRGVAVQRSDRTINLGENRDESWLWIWREKKKFVW